MAVIFVASPESLPVGLQQADPNWDSILTAISQVNADEDIVLVTRSAAAERVARGVRLSLNTERVGIYTSTVPPTLFFVLAATLALLPSDRLGVVGAVERRVIASSYTQVLMSSVARVSHPNPTLLDHVISLVPGTRYLVDWTNQQIKRQKDLNPLEAPLYVTAYSAQQWPAEKVKPLPANAITLPSQPTPSWEARRWIEASAVFQQPEQIARETAGLHEVGRSAACVSCRRSGSDQRCIFCGVPVGHLELSVNSVPQTDLGGNS